MDGNHKSFDKQLTLILCLILFGCSQKNDKNQSGSSLIEKNRLIQISLSTEGRKQDTTGAFAIEINKDLLVNYYGGSQSGLTGNYEGKIELSDWNTLTKKIDYTQIKDTVLSKKSFEDNYFDLSIKFENKDYFIRGYYSNAPKYVKNICELVLSIKRKINFMKVSKVHVFEVQANKERHKHLDKNEFIVPEVK